MNNHGVIISHIEWDITIFHKIFNRKIIKFWYPIVYFRSDVLRFSGKERLENCRDRFYCYCLALFNITADCKKRIGVRCLPPTSRHQGFFGLDFTKIMTYLFGDCPISFNFFDNTTFVDLLLGEIPTIIIVKNLQAPSYVLIYFYLRIVLFNRL